MTRSEGAYYSVLYERLRTQSPGNTTTRHAEPEHRSHAGQRTPSPVVSEAQLKALLATCEKAKDSTGGRDHALLRRGELAALAMDDVDLETHVLVVRKSKTHRGRVAPITRKPRR